MTADGGDPTRSRRKVRPVAPPRARDSRMDRPPSKPDPNWLFVMVPTDAARSVERVQIADRDLRRWKYGAGILSTLLVCLLVAVAFAWPRSRAYGALVQENLELKERLEAVDRKMSEVDRILLRLRLYDAQLESLGAPLGSSGPIPLAASANAALLEEAPGEGSPGDVLAGAAPPADEGGEWEAGGAGEAAEDNVTEDQGIRAAQAWASAVEARADTFLAMFAVTEPNLNLLMEEMESLESLERALPSLWPGEGHLNSGYGWRRNPFGVRWKHHSGIDVDGRTGDPIYATADGTVLRSGWLGGYGKALEIGHGYGVTTLYGHCSQVFVQAGDVVKRGEKIALIGSTGRSTGPHLHLEVRLDGHPVDPLQYLQIPPQARRKVDTRRSLPIGAEVEQPTVGEEGHEE